MYFKNPKIPQKFLEQILQNVYSRIGLTNLEDFKKYLIRNVVVFENVKNKLEIEALWNELILIKFSSKIKIENQIITSLDINNELKYLVALNPNLKNLKKNDIIQL